MTTSSTRDDCTCTVDVVAHDAAPDCPLHHVEPIDPTPPADTRQQAADVLLAHFWAVDDDRVCLCGWTPVEAAEQWAWLLENDSPEAEADAAGEAIAAEFARHQAAALASSSPALPEPPATAAPEPRQDT